MKYGVLAFICCISMVHCVRVKVEVIKILQDISYKVEMKIGTVEII